jgi:FkbM family methyltransferase
LVDHLELALVRRVLRRGGDYVEAGAHIGVYAVTACRDLVAESRALLLEPNPDALALLVPNLKAFDRATICKAAASDRVGTSVLHLPSTADAAWARVGDGAFPGGRSVEVLTTTVDVEVDRLGLLPSFIKIDVEGHELAVLAGAMTTMRGARPVVLCEVSGDTAQAVSEIAKGLAYDLFRVHPRRLTLGFGEPRGVFNVVLLPSEHPGAPDVARTGNPARLFTRH